MDVEHATIVSDLSQCRPAGALSERRARWRWTKVPYQAGGIAGTLLMAGPETQAPPVTLGLGVQGWHGIFLGVYSDQWAGPDCLRVKLTGDPCFVPVVRADPGFDSTILIDDVFWKYADLTGQDLTIAQMASGSGRQAGLAYVRLAPLSAEEVAAVLADRRRLETRRLIAMDDNFSFYCDRRATVADIWEQIEPYRDTDVGRLFWCAGAGGDVVSYPTRVGRVIGIAEEDFPTSAYRYVGESMRLLLGQGVDGMQVARDYTHSLGIEFHISLRLGAFQMFPGFDEFFTSEFYRGHPEWHCVDRDGTPIARLSYAYPEVQDHVLAVLEELASYEPDGLNLIFTRCAPYLLYEEPLIVGYRARTGVDPRQLDEHDPGYLRYRGEVVTGFMRRVRALCAHKTSRRGQRLLLSGNVLNNEAENLFYGLDVATWAREGILDLMVPDTWLGKPIDFEYFAGITRGTPCELYAQIMPRRMPAGEYRRRALQAYAAGAQGLCLWDASGRYPILPEWNTARRLGHKDELTADGDGADQYSCAIPVKTLGGYTVDRYPPYWSY